MAGIDVEAVLYLLALLWAGVWIGLWFASRRVRRLTLPVYASVTAIALPTLAGTVLAMYQLLSIDVNDDPTFVTIHAVGCLLPIITGLFVSLIMASMFLYATRRQKRKETGVPRQQPHRRKLLEVLRPQGRSLYSFLAVLTAACLVWLKWPEPVQEVLSNQLLQSLFGSAITAGLIVVTLIVRRRAPTGKWRQVGQVLPVTTLVMAGMTLLGWLWYLADRYHWDVRWQLAFAGIGFFGIVGSHLAWLAASTYKEVRKRRENDPKCSNCGYILYHAAGGRCPECGQPFDISELNLERATIDKDGIIRPR